MSLYSCGGGANTLRRISTLKSDLISLPSDAMYWIYSDSFIGIACFDSVVKGHRIISSTQRSTSDNQLCANIIAVWGDPFLSTSALSVIMDYQVNPTDVI